MNKNKQVVFDDITVSRSRSQIEPFLITESVCSGTGETAVSLHNDLYLLLNQKRLDKMTLDALTKWLDETSHLNQVDGLDTIRKNISDDELLQFMKSRYVQSPSELQSYSRYLTAVAIQRQNEKQKSKD